MLCIMAILPVCRFTSARPKKSSGTRLVAWVNKRNFHCWYRTYCFKWYANCMGKAVSTKSKALKIMHTNCSPQESRLVYWGEGGLGSTSSTLLCFGPLLFLEVFSRTRTGILISIAYAMEIFCVVQLYSVFRDEISYYFCSTIIVSTQMFVVVGNVKLNYIPVQKNKLTIKFTLLIVKL